MKLPADDPTTTAVNEAAACTGDSSNAGYRVQSFLVPESVNLDTLKFNPGEGPVPVTGEVRQPLFFVNGSPLVDVQTANAVPAGGPGPIIQPFDAFNFNVFPPNFLTPGVYKIGIACTLGGATSPTQLDKYWNTLVTISADPSDPGGADIRFVVAGAPVTTTTLPVTTTTTLPVTTTTLPVTTTTRPVTTTTLPVTTTTLPVTTTTRPVTTTTLPVTTTTTLPVTTTTTLPVTTTTTLPVTTTTLPVTTTTTQPPPPDQPECAGLSATIVGTQGDDDLVGTSGRDVIVGLGGNDLIRGLGGADVICGGGGDDRLVGGSGGDRIIGGAGADYIAGAAGNDHLSGSDGDDLIRGGTGDDKLDGRDGFDDCRPGDGQDIVVNCESSGRRLAMAAKAG